ncbi:MAG TPA: hypothetical protein VFW07_14810 [Parafilimonas sp.]|nr:hypothetical protein [Parafilimonas sp.]
MTEEQQKAAERIIWDGDALWSAYNDPKPQHPQIIDMLIEAGAHVEPGWEKYINEIKTEKNQASDA